MSSSSTDTLIDVQMPQLGVSVAEGTVIEWKKQAGDRVDAEEAIATISTDKIDTDIESPATGQVAEILVEIGAVVGTGTVLARIAPDREADADDEADAEADAAPRRPGAPRRYSPVATRIAAEHGVDLDQVEGTGRGGRVRKQDVLAHIEHEAKTTLEPPIHSESPYSPEVPAARQPGQSRPLSSIRQAIGKRMLHSLRTAATCTTIVEVDMSRVESARRQTGFTYLPYIARATIDTLREYPSLNATLEDDALTTYAGVHLGIAVSLGERGLVVPVIRDAQDLTVEGLARQIEALAKGARANELTADELQGGSFTITNAGGYGSIIATPVINPPQVAILDTEAVVKRPVVVTDELGNDSIAIRPLSYFCMSWDHRALDGALAAQFLAALRRRLEDRAP